MEKLTNKQTKILEIIKSFINKNGYSPTLGELKDLLNKKNWKLSSINSVVQYLNVLQEKGYIQRFSKSRGIRVLNEGLKNFVEIPLFGQADCGEALSFADDCAEDFMNISKQYIKGDAKDYFLIKAVGDSMNKENINDSDYVLIRKIKGNIKNNKNVLAVINGLATIKKFVKKKNTTALIPQSTNPKHLPIILHPDDQVYICGEVVMSFGV